MRKVIFITLITAYTLLTPYTSSSNASSNSEKTVYICTGPKAKVYHNSPNCKGLDKCSGSIKKIKKSETNRRPCKICAKRG